MLNIISQASDLTHGPPLICLYVIMPFSPLLERYYKDLLDNKVDYNFHKGSKWGRGEKGIVAIQLDEYDHIFFFTVYENVPILSNALLQRSHFN